MVKYYGTKTLKIEIATSPGADFVASAMGQKGEGNGIQNAFLNLGNALYRRHSALAKVSREDLSEKAAEELDALAELLGQ